jgi:APA family basic amino acid/polyamine antiporter
VWGFPVVPAFFMISVLAIAITVLIERPLQSFSGLIILALGIPAYYYWRHKSTATNTTT